MQGTHPSDILKGGLRVVGISHRLHPLIRQIRGLHLRSHLCLLYLRLLHLTLPVEVLIMVRTCGAVVCATAAAILATAGFVGKAGAGASLPGLSIGKKPSI